MAKKKILDRPKPITDKVLQMCEETMEALCKNFQVQGIYPFGEVYAGWFTKNEEAGPTQWKSTGAGFDSFYFHMLHASEDFNLTVRDWAVEFMYNYYLNFVDMGVGRGRPIGKVQRSLAADHDIRYMSSWNPREGSTQRPALAMEFRHQARRMRNYMARRYMYDAQVVVLNTIDGLDLTIHV
jgi:hypothetical protein